MGSRDINKHMDQLIDEVHTWSKMLHEQKENSKQHGASFLTVGMRKAYERLKVAVDDLKQYY